MKAKIYVGAKKYALYIGRKIVEKTLEFLTLPARFVSKKVQELKNLTMLGNSKQGVLPDGYTQLEYIESTGTQHIAIPEREYVSGEELEIDFAYTTFSGTFPTIYGSYLSEIYTNVTGDVLSYGNIQISEPQNFILNQKQTIKAKFISTITVTQGLFAYGQGGPNFTYRSKGKLYKFINRLNGVDVYNMLPARRNSDNVLGMYDLVTNTFFPNAGEGEFISGGTAPTPTAPIEVESVGDKTVNVIDNNNKGLNALVINSTTGSTVQWGSAWTYIDYTEIKPNTEYTFYNKDLADLKFAEDRGYAFYDENKNFISGGYRTNTNIVNFTTPNNAKYFRVSVMTTGTYMLVEGAYTASTATPYEPYGYKVPVEVSGKNLFDKNDTSSYIAGYLESNGTIATNNGYTILLECKPNTTYTFSRKESSNRYRVGSTPRLKENIKVNTSGITLISSKRVDETVLIDTFTTTSDAKTLVIWFTNTSDLSVLQSQLNQIQIEEGTQATEYQPYIAPTTTNIYLSEPLRKIGEYADTLSVDGTEVTVVRNVKEVVLNGSESWFYAVSSKNYGNYFYLTIQNAINKNGSSCVVSSYFKNKSATYAYITPNENYKIWVEDGRNLKINYFEIKDVNSFKNYLQTNNVTLDYVLATPTTETYTIENPIQFEQGAVILNVDTITPPSKINITGDIDNE